MAYKLIGKNFTPHDVVAKVTGTGEIRRGFPRRGHGVLQAADQPDAACEDPQHRRIRGAEDAGRARHSHRRRRAAVPAAAATDPDRRTRCSLSAIRSSRSPPWTRPPRPTRCEKVKIDFEQLPLVRRSARQPVSRAARMRGPTATSAAAQINLQTVKWQAARLRRRQDSCRWASRPRTGPTAISTPASRHRSW